MRLNLLTLILIGFLVLGVIVYNIIGPFFNTLGLGQPFVCMATGIIMIEIALIPMIVYGLYRNSLDKERNLKQRVNEIRPRPCPHCRTPLVFHKEYGYYCERCFKYIN